MARVTGSQHLVARLRDQVLEQMFLLLRRIRPARERVTMGEYNDHVEREHAARYEFARQFCVGKTVADIACGTGYGSRILSQVASRVDGYDREPLCGNRIIDLEKESWSEKYDVIVSFETIEHLADPHFFLENARKTAGRLIVSSPIGELWGYNPHHKQVWSLPEFHAIVEKYFRCSYYYQEDHVIQDTPPKRVRFVIAVGTPVEPAAP